MPLTPPISMPIPWSLLRQSATITARTSTQETAGSYEMTDGTSYTCKCWVQPASSSDSVYYRRETGRSLFTIYLAPTLTNGTATASVLSHIAKITVDGVTFEVNGEPINLCSAGKVLQLSVFREV
jgi:hypothetical protein